MGACSLRRIARLGVDIIPTLMLPLFSAGLASAGEGVTKFVTAADAFLGVIE